MKTREGEIIDFKETKGADHHSRILSYPLSPFKFGRNRD